MNKDRPVLGTGERVEGAKGQTGKGRSRKATVNRVMAVTVIVMSAMMTLTRPMIAVMRAVTMMMTRT